MEIKGSNILERIIGAVITAALIAVAGYFFDIITGKPSAFTLLLVGLVALATSIILAFAWQGFRQFLTLLGKWAIEHWRYVLGAVLLAVVGYILWSFYSQVETLEESITERDQEITSARATQTAQIEDLSAIRTALANQEQEMVSVEATQTSQAKHLLSIESTRVAEATEWASVLATKTLLETATLKATTELKPPFSARAGDVYTRPIDGMTMLFVPAGWFAMGSPEGVGDDDEHPQHNVYLDSYWIDKTEVTNAQYGQCIEADACDVPGCWEDRNFNSSEQPVVCVSWDDAKAYCEWAGARLLTEAEWEKAARGTDGWIYPWGNEFDCHKGNFDDETLVDDGLVEGGKGCDGFDTTAPVGRFPDGASPYGVLDMAGNAWEWVADWYDADYYSATSPSRNPLGPVAGEYRAIRGGSWLTVDSKRLRSVFREKFDPSGRPERRGFRCGMWHTSPDEWQVLRDDQNTELGRPITPIEESMAATGTRISHQVFEDGEVYASGGSAYAIYGPVLEHYRRSGGPLDTCLGAPIASINAVTSYSDIEGVMMEFEGPGPPNHSSLIYASDKGNATLCGWIRWEYSQENGGHSGWLGFPVKDVLYFDESMIQVFENGYIVYYHPVVDGERDYNRRPEAYSFPASRGTLVDVHAQQEWQDSEIEVRLGDQVTVIQVGGSWATMSDEEGFDANSTIVAGSAGIAELPSARVGALIGRIGEGNAFLIGRWAVFKAQENGNLHLAMNDHYYDDNVGFITVEVFVEPSE